MINIMRKTPSIKYSTSGPSNYVKGIVLKAILDNPWSHRRKLHQLTGFSDGSILNCINLFEDNGFISCKNILTGGVPVKGYAVTDDEEVIVRVNKSIEKAPKCEPETQEQRAKRRIPTMLVKKGLTRKMLIKALALDGGAVDRALKGLESKGIVRRTKPKDAKKRNSPLVYQLS